MTNSSSVSVVQKAIQEMAYMFTGFAEEILAVIAVRFVSAAGIVILGHNDKANGIGSVSINDNGYNKDPAGVKKDGCGLPPLK